MEFLGAAFRNVPRGVEAVFVMERPGVTLKSYLVDHPGNNPADNSMSVLNVIRWTQQIVNALIAVHSMFHGCVHGDIRLENVLVSEYSHPGDTLYISEELTQNVLKNVQLSRLQHMQFCVLLLKDMLKTPPCDI